MIVRYMQTAFGNHEWHAHQCNIPYVTHVSDRSYSNKCNMHCLHSYIILSLCLSYKCQRNTLYNALAEMRYHTAQVWYSFSIILMHMLAYKYWSKHQHFIGKPIKTNREWKISNRSNTETKYSVLGDGNGLLIIICKYTCIPPCHVLHCFINI